MSEVLDTPEVAAPPIEAAPSLRDAFAARHTIEEAAPVATESAPTEQNTPEAPPTKTDDAPPAAKPTDYGDLLKELGVENVDALKDKWGKVKDVDPTAVETLKANQRDDHDKAIRDMLADPVKARVYFELQSTDFAELAKSDPQAALFAEYRHKNPSLTADLAKIKFDRLQAAEYPHLLDGEEGDPLYEQDKQLQAHAAAEAAKTMEGAKEAAKVAALPKPAEAEGPTPAQQAEAARQWTTSVEAALTKPLDYTVQVDGKPVTVALDSKDPALKEFLQFPEEKLGTLLQKLAYPNGFDQAPDMQALAGLYGRLMQPDAIAAAAAASARAAIGAHKTLTDLSNPAPDAPQPVVGSAAGGYQSAFANARAAS